jgi:hypothetical protein
VRKTILPEGLFRSSSLFISGLRPIAPDFSQSNGNISRNCWPSDTLFLSKKPSLKYSTFAGKPSLMGRLTCNVTFIGPSKFDTRALISLKVAADFTTI